MQPCSVHHGHSVGRSEMSSSGFALAASRQRAHHAALGSHALPRGLSGAAATPVGTRWDKSGISAPEWPFDAALVIAKEIMERKVLQRFSKIQGTPSDVSQALL